jgi:hypothetical protein
VAALRPLGSPIEAVSRSGGPPHSQNVVAGFFSRINKDSAEEPNLIENEQLKTPPKRSTHAGKIVCGAF